MKTKFYSIQYRENKNSSWKEFDEVEYTEEEANEFISAYKNNSELEFRKSLICERETEFYSVSRNG